MNGKNVKSVVRRRVGNNKNVSISGRKMLIAPQPPEITSRPWYHLVVRMPNQSSTVTFANIRTALISQLGLEAAQSIHFKLESVRVWAALNAAVGTVLDPLIVNIYDPIITGSGTTRVLEQFTRYPDAVNRACIGFEYPTAQRCTVIDGLSTAGLLIASGLGDHSIIYVSLLWRSGNVLV